jgi:hypothetical protein
LIGTVAITLAEAVVFACFDKQLLKAAQNEGLMVWPQDPG